MTYTRASLRRQLALTPVGLRWQLRDTLFDAAGAPPEDGPDKLVAYLCDPLARAIVAPPGNTALTEWLGGPLFVPVAACNFSPIATDAVAVLCGEMLGANGRLSGALTKWRFSPRTDDAIAAAIQTMQPDDAAREIERLAAESGPDEARLHLALLQAGRALAWNEAMWERPFATGLVDQLLALLAPTSPTPLLNATAAVLAPIAYVAAPLGSHVREQAARILRAHVNLIADPRPASSFADLVGDLAQKRNVPDQDYWASMPKRAVVQACAHILGSGAPPEPERFAPYQEAILAEMSELIFPAFVDGLIASAATPQLTALVEALAQGDRESRTLALHIAGRYPIDAHANAAIAALEQSDVETRLAAVAAVAWLEGAAATEALASRLTDPEPEVAGRAARALVDRGEVERVRSAAAGNLATTRPALLAVIAGDLTTRPISTLVTSALDALEAPDGASVLVESVVMDVLGHALFGSATGLATCANLLSGAAVSLPIVALAAAHDSEALVDGISVPPDGGRELALELFKLAAQGGEAEAQAMVVLARMFCGDHDIVAPLATALEHTEGWADHVIAAIATLRVRDAAFSRVLTPFLADKEHIGARVLACAAAGRALPVDDPAWAHVEELLALGSLAASAAWSALNDRVRSDLR